MTEQVNYLRGAFVTYPPGGYPDDKRVIPFRFNPESLSRQLSVEQGEGGGNENASGDSADSGTEQGADASSGSLKESFNVLIRFDFAERVDGANSLPSELGIAPEIAALEDLLYPIASETEAPADGTEPTRARPQRWTVLFVWGRKRVLPVRITGMTFNETMYNNELNPVRAEVDISLEVLSEADARDNLAVGDALSFTGQQRRRLAEEFFNETSSQNTNVIPL